ncbi:hypothetical protein [Rhodanobacter sp. B2A1Ga4]|uniref:hypothetical protein n=1 Tax=Rhodanobacter sp. B2A1Ga4 TaxID=2778647 RepID=UPI001FD281C6|nr:hypothetical protein [Rhodanobacter sp. B2A1Ga4]
MWHWLRDSCKAGEAEIDWFAENPRPPDLIGVNHYVTSDRFLDDNLEKYPPDHHGGNGQHGYVDLEAARTISEPVGDIAPLLGEVWQRYGLPIAVTEAHIDAKREDQMRRLAALWCGAQEARRAGADVRALTVWGMLGSYDWNCLLTECHGYYEAGAFDVGGGQARATALTVLIRSFARGARADHPALCGAGWWQRPQRFEGSPVVTLERRVPPLRTSLATIPHRS